MSKSPVVRIDHHPGRSAQTFGMAKVLGTDTSLIHEPSVGVVGTKGDSQCYMGVTSKVDAIHAALKSRIGRGEGQLRLRLVQPEYTIATSDGIRNGTREMRYSLIGREVTHDALSEHLNATGLAGTIAVTFIGVVGMQPLHMVAPPSDDPRRLKEFPDQLVEYLAQMMAKGLKPRDIVVRDSIRNAVIVSLAIGGSTNVTLHAPEIARAAGFSDFWKDVMTPAEFNYLSQYVVPVLTDARPYGKYSMVDIDAVGGVQVIVRELLEAGLLNGDVMTCTGETLSEQVKRLGTPSADGRVIYTVAKPYKPTGGLRVLGGNLSPEFSAILKLAGVEGGLEDNLFRGKARVFEGEQHLLAALDTTPEKFENHDMVIVRYEGPSGAPGMPEMLDPTSRITTLCRERGIVVALMTDARFSGGSVGLVIGHVGPEAALGGPIALVEDGDEIIADLNSNELTCTALADPAIFSRRKAIWDKAVADNDGIHPNCGDADTRLLHRARLSAVPATRGAGLHPNREVWVRQPREAVRSGFVPTNKHRPEANKAY